MCFLVFWLFLICVVRFSNCITIGNSDSTQNITDAILELSNLAIQGRQYGSYYPSYYQSYKPYKQNYGGTHGYLTNEVYNSPNIYGRPSENLPFYNRLPFLENHRQSIMDALYSIAQNDDLQCVPKLLCEITAGGLVGRQSPVNINLDSLLLLLSGVNSANMSPVVHFGKAAFLGFASRGNTRQCEYAYPKCPVNPDKLIQYLNNHNGGFFRFFQGLNKPTQGYQQNYAQYFNKYRPNRFRNYNIAEDRIQTRPFNSLDNDIQSDYDYYYKTGKKLQFPEYPEPIHYPYNTNKDNHQFVFPSSDETSSPFRKGLKFPELNDYSHRGGKKLNFHQYNNYNDDNDLDIQRPLPNHQPTPNIFPDRTGTGELKLDLEDVEKNYRDSIIFDDDKYRDLLYDSFPKDKQYRKPSKINFPRK
ncbi:uncharacterized protein LOC143197687 [Rhynchophorus ferrugineus]